MPYREHKVKRIYFRIGEVCEKINKRLELSGKRAVVPSMLRFYEAFHITLRPSKYAKNGTRLYRKAEIDTITRFIRILKTKWFTLDGAVQVIKGRLEVVIKDLESGL